MSEKRLTADEKNFYAENGFILVKNVFPASEAAAFRAAGHARSIGSSSFARSNPHGTPSREKAHKFTTAMMCSFTRRSLAGCCSTPG